MAIITVPADSSTLTLNGRVIQAYEAGDVYTLTPANPSTAHTNSSDGGVTIHERVDRGVHDLTVRVQKFSDDDIFLNGLRNAPAEVIDGSLKEVFSKDGAEGVDTHELATGSVTTQPTPVKSDTDGNSLMEYVIRFRNVVRAI